MYLVRTLAVLPNTTVRMVDRLLSTVEQPLGVHPSKVATYATTSPSRGVVLTLRRHRRQFSWTVPVDMVPVQWILLDT